MYEGLTREEKIAAMDAAVLKTAKEIILKRRSEGLPVECCHSVAQGIISDFVNSIRIFPHAGEFIVTDQIYQSSYLKFYVLTENDLKTE